MVQPRSRKRGGFTLIELLVVMAIMATLAAMGMAGYQKVREVAKRIECTNNLRSMGVAMLNFESSNSGFPSDKNTQNYSGYSFYTQLLDNLELGALNPQNVATPPAGQARPYVCPGRRTAQQAVGACDYGYVQSSGSTAQSVLDASPAGVSATTISNAAGTQNTAVLSHYWLSAQSYSKSTPSWNTPNSGYAVSYSNGTKGYKDTDTTGSGKMGSPHPNGMPCVFADGHCGVLPYNHKQFQMLWDYSNTTVARDNLP
jgi:prepilin-type N-terminal cleavage/methylation domain-containing protein/prepilin-type processing-associated H-X9-DG protein